MNVTSIACVPRPPVVVHRLAELVAHLAGCPAPSAVAAVERSLPAGDDGLSAEQRLAVVARALVLVRRHRDAATSVVAS